MIALLLDLAATLLTAVAALAACVFFGSLVAAGLAPRWRRVPPDAAGHPRGPGGRCLVCGGRDH